MACYADKDWVSEKPFLVGDSKTFTPGKPMPKKPPVIITYFYNVLVTKVAISRLLLSHCVTFLKEHTLITTTKVESLEMQLIV